ncbi:MAG: hypothetical protein ACO3PI_03305 [Burkholderiaceae bacterium]
MVLVKSQFAEYILSGQQVSQSLSSHTSRAQSSMRNAAQSMRETTSLQWAENLHGAEERSVEERLLDAA